MLTYVINTSENKTFDSHMLFELAGYSKIRWIHCMLNEVDGVAAEICERQNVVGAERFRIAVIVDFYNFNRIRKPYGYDSFRSDGGVDLSLYIPYIEVYLLDNLVSVFERKNLYAEDFEVFYVQNEKSDRYDLFKNAKSQLREILHGVGSPLLSEEGEETTPAEAPAEAPAAAKKEEEISVATNADVQAEEAELLSTRCGDDDSKWDGRQEREDPAWGYSEEEGYTPDPDEDKHFYSEFSLYCTENVSLTFNLQGYPYGKKAMTFSGFREAFRTRQTYISSLRRHFYIIPYGGGSARAALGLLSLSLYLIRMYEREERIPSDGEMDMFCIEPSLLRDVLETAWNKVMIAKGVVKKSSMEYYALEQVAGENETIEIPRSEAEVNLAREEALAQSRAEVSTYPEKDKLTTEQLYDRIVGMADPGTLRLEEDKQREFDAIMSEYLRARDTTKEASVKAEFDDLRKGGFLKMTDQCPSREEYNHFVEQKKKNISILFEKVLKADYIAVDYLEEKKKANEVYLNFRRANASMHRNIIGDALFLLLALVAVLAPYWVLQLNGQNAQMAASIALVGQAAIGFGGLFVLAMILRYIPIFRALRRTRREMQECYLACCAKHHFSFSSLKTRYQKDLVAIEQSRYDLRQLKYLYDANHEKESLITSHRETLEQLEDCLGAILNNLDVEPIHDPLIPIDGELNLERSVSSKENKIYQVFSVETIERMLPTKGSDRT